MSTLALSVLVLAAGAHAHQVAWAKGMYCKNGLSKTDSPNESYPINPLFNLTTSGWFLHGQCKNYPPPAGEYLSIPANGKFTVEIASNRAWTTFSYGGTKVTDWPDGRVHPNNWSTNITDPNFPPSSVGCIGSPNLHAHGKIDAAGTVFSIAYKSDIKSVKLSDFTVFSVLPNTPFKRLATYQVPNLPACPSGGCICMWGWVPNGCGQSNMYQLPFKCKVTGAKLTATPLGKPKVPVWCQSNQKACVKGPKQMVIQYQASGNNVVLPPGMQAEGGWPSPGYNSKMGFTAGAQTDIFVTATVKGQAVETASAASAAVTAAAAATDDDDLVASSTASVTTSGTVVGLPTASALTGSARRSFGHETYLFPVLHISLFSWILSHL
ncbi:hypothetical protein EXIGLDRAFT_772722 [Exidia glandulosa HHB12029]|uniref:Uncharacterized protein n=1 Tax=Exidia glandulosa HHB12029 TaxID=1314781 RepID=A0A165F635_EXIGL|nr:hypothetical protein EXIGLDRAFT_772722 [Exidia glandulosa HHB12029]